MAQSEKKRCNLWASVSRDNKVLGTGSTSEAIHKAQAAGYKEFYLWRIVETCWWTETHSKLVNVLVKTLFPRKGGVGLQISLECHCPNCNISISPETSQCPKCHAIINPSKFVHGDSTEDK